ncbi:hypothetical protein AB0E81_14650 [Streptomyces sp. NPDC033538]|uniref:hypothetical protein n=1 Tax=Streptomyces sp. NPDC033538 TaxID=3155367 RepID=UPI0033CB855C
MTGGANKVSLIEAQRNCRTSAPATSTAGGTSALRPRTASRGPRTARCSAGGCPPSGAGATRDRPRALASMTPRRSSSRGWKPG